MVKDYKIHGVALPSHITQYLALFCAFKNKTKSSIIKTLIQNWYVQNNSKYNQTELVKLLIDQGRSEWHCIKSSLISSYSPEAKIAEQYNLFKLEFENFLRKKGVGELLRINIVNSIKL